MYRVNTEHYYSFDFDSFVKAVNFAKSAMDSINNDYVSMWRIDKNGHFHSYVDCLENSGIFVTNRLNAFIDED